MHNWWAGAIVSEVSSPSIGLLGSPAGYAALVAGQKMYRLLGSVIYFSGVGNPGENNPLNGIPGTGPNVVNPGAGFIDTSLLAGESQVLVGAAPYYQQVAVFSRRTCLMFAFDPDPTQNKLLQVLKIGAVSNASILQFGTGDVLFLSDSGVRSLRALNASMAAGVTDVGSPIDDIIQGVIQTDDVSAETSHGIIEPRTGRYWLAIGSTIYVLSYWPSAKINAWSTFSLPFVVDHMTVAADRVYIRSGNDVYLYGGLDGNTYDTCTATATTPHHSAESPTTVKDVEAVNAMLVGPWSVEIGMAADVEGFFEPVANLVGSTYAMQRIPFAGSGTHIGFRFTTNYAGPAKLGALSVKFQKTEEK
jgi:hypothetical protein